MQEGERHEGGPGGFPSRRLCSMGTRATQQAEDSMWPLQPLVRRRSLPGRAWHADQTYSGLNPSMAKPWMGCPSDGCRV